MLTQPSKFAACCFLPILYLSLGIAEAKGANDPFLVGVCTHINPAGTTLQDDMGIIQDVGLTSIRNDIYWKDVELSPGQLSIPKGLDQLVQQSVDKHIEPLLVLGYGNKFYDGGDKPRSDAAINAYARYAEFVVRHFSGKVHLYEIWNEWNWTLGAPDRGSHVTPGTAPDYVHLLSIVYPRIKAIDPAIVVIGGAISPGGIRGGFVEKEISAGIVHSADAFSFHPYNWQKESSEQRGSQDWADELNKTEAELRNANKGKNFPIYVTEIGWPTFVGDKGSSQNEAADKAAQMLLIGKSMPYLKGLWWYDLRDDGETKSDPENNFGLVTFDKIPKPVYSVVKNLMHLMTDGQFISQVSVADPSVRALQFQLPDGQKKTAIWSNAAGQTVKKLTVTAADGQRLQLSHIEDSRGATVRIGRKTSSLKVSGASAPSIVDGTIASVK